jgi:hypothetical protein
LHQQLLVNNVFAEQVHDSKFAPTAFSKKFAAIMLTMNFKIQTLQEELYNKI